MSFHYIPEFFIPLNLSSFWWFKNRRQSKERIQKKTGLSGNFSQTRGNLTQTHLFMFVYQVFFACQNHPEVPKHVLQKWGGLNSFFFCQLLKHVAIGSDINVFNFMLCAVMRITQFCKAYCITGQCDYVLPVSNIEN